MEGLALFSGTQSPSSQAAHLIDRATSLSARLSYLTENATFSSAAQLSARFIQSQLYDGFVVQNSIALNNCTRTSDPSQLMADESGFFLEGLSMLSRTDSTWLPLCVLRCFALSLSLD